MSWSEVAALGLRYGKYPLALLLVEAFYWFLTEPSDTLAPLQVVEAWMWHGITEIIWGADAVSLSQHNGWTTRIDFHHSSFPGTFDSVGLYVSDECAGVHEMIFLSTLILITDDVPQRDRLRAVAVGCALVFILNLARLVAFYPLALGGCLEAPNDPACLNDMWAFHRHVYEWGFLVVLIGLWLAWFTWVGGPRRVKDRSMAGRDRWRITPRKAWAWSEHRPVWQQPIMGTALAAVLLLTALYMVRSDPAASPRTIIVTEQPSFAKIFANSKAMIPAPAMATRRGRKASFAIESESKMLLSSNGMAGERVGLDPVATRM